MTIGIYCIENTSNNKKYIGKSLNIEKRWWNHRWKLKANIHDCIHLQSSWNLYGSECFIFRILEVCKKELLETREIFWIKNYKTKNPKFGYNMTNGGKGTSGRKLTDEEKNKRSLQNSGEGNPFFGKHHTEETKKIMSSKKKGIVPWDKGVSRPPISEEHKKKLIQSNIGRHPSLETRKKISMSEKETKRRNKENKDE